MAPILCYGETYLFTWNPTGILSKYKFIYKFEHKSKRNKPPKANKSSCDESHVQIERFYSTNDSRFSSLLSFLQLVQVLKLGNFLFTSTSPFAIFLFACFLLNKQLSSQSEKYTISPVYGVSRKGSFHSLEIRLSKRGRYMTFRVLLEMLFAINTLTSCCNRTFSKTYTVSLDVL